MEVSSPVSPPPPASVEPASGFRPSVHPLLAILACALTNTAGEVFRKVGAAETADTPTTVQWLGLTAMVSPWVWGGIVFTILSFLAWIRAVRVIPLSIAFTLSNVVHVFVPLSCWIFLGEQISQRRWLGIALVVIGLIIVAPAAARLDSKLEKAL